MSIQYPNIFVNGIVGITLLKKLAIAFILLLGVNLNKSAKPSDQINTYKTIVSIILIFYFLYLSKFFIQFLVKQGKY
jgi:hypothetical protein